MLNIFRVFIFRHKIAAESSVGPINFWHSKLFAGAQNSSICLLHQWKKQTNLVVLKTVWPSYPCSWSQILSLLSPPPKNRLCCFIEASQQRESQTESLTRKDIKNCSITHRICQTTPLGIIILNLRTTASTSGTWYSIRKQCRSQEPKVCLILIRNGNILGRRDYLALGSYIKPTPSFGIRFMIKSVTR